MILCILQLEQGFLCVPNNSFIVLFIIFKKFWYSVNTAKIVQIALFGLSKTISLKLYEVLHRDNLYIQRFMKEWNKTLLYSFVGTSEEVIICLRIIVFLLSNHIACEDWNIEFK